MRHTTVQVNGIELHLRSMGEPTAPLVLFLHGFPEYSGAWDDVFGRGGNGDGGHERTLGWDSEGEHERSNPVRLRDARAPLK